MNIVQRQNLAYALTASMYNIKWPLGAQEPDYVALMTINLPGEINNALSRLLPGRHIASGCAFIHQKPLAHFLQIPCPKCPELGDMLVVCRERRASGAVYNAMLLQAKCVANQFQSKISKTDNHQFVLYSQWPLFEYRRADVLDGQIRDIEPKSITQGAQYLLINKKSPAEMFTATVDNPLNGSMLFSHTLASILSFAAGRTFDAFDSREEWSMMIVDLLRIASNSLFNRRVYAGIRDENRWHGPDAFNAIVSLEKQDAALASLKRQKDSGEPFRGMGVICIDLGEAPVADKEPERD